MIKKTITVELESGLEARPIAMLVQLASQFASSIYLESENKKVNANNIMGMMTMALKNGTKVTVLADGEDERAAVTGIESYLTNQ